MKKRLRKKLQQREFREVTFSVTISNVRKTITITEGMLKGAKMGPYQELAWELQFELQPDLSESERQEFVDEMAAFAEDNQLGLAGQNGDYVVVSIANRKAVTIEEQQLLKKWLSERSEVNSVHQSTDDGYTDAWHEQLMRCLEPQTATFIKFYS